MSYPQVNNVTNVTLLLNVTLGVASKKQRDPLLYAIGHSYPHVLLININVK